MNPSPYLIKNQKSWLITGLALTAVDTVYAVIVLIYAFMTNASEAIPGLLLETTAHVVALVLLIIGLAKSGEYYREQKKSADSSTASPHNTDAQ